MSSKAKLFVFAAPSGAGKTSIVNFLLEEEKRLSFSISATTRPPRAGEVEGVNYYYFSEEAFKKQIEEDKFLEWEEVYPGSFYGTLHSEVDQKLSEGKSILFDIDVEGAMSIKKTYKERAVLIFVKPPSIEVLKDRLIKRNTETLEKLAARIAKAEIELEYEPYFDLSVINDNLAEAQQNALKIIHYYLD